MRWDVAGRLALGAVRARQKTTAWSFSSLSCRLISIQSSKPHYTTTPIFYVNGAPHIGHLHSVVLADVFSRWAEWRNKGWSVAPLDHETAVQVAPVLATGTDEHGIKIQKAAESAGISPRELCDKFSQTFRTLASAAGARDFRFIRTTDQDHVEAVKGLWTQLQQGGFIYKSTHEGWYAISDEAFYTASQIIPSPADSNVMLSVETGSVVEWSSEETYKFKLASFQQPLLDWLESHPDAIVPASRRDDLIEELKQGLSDLSISRPKSRLQWGITVPSDEDHVIYVWLDALTNYLTVAGYPWKNADTMGCWPSDVQIIGKDIVRFHAVYFPAILMALNLPPPKHLVTHGHWTVQKAKMSKSRGNVSDPHAAMELHGRDEMRWFMCRLGGNLGSDSDWSPSTFEEYHKKHLAGQWGNQLCRVMAPKILKQLSDDINTNSTSALESISFKLTKPIFTEEDKLMVEALEQLATRYDDHMSRYEIHRALECIGEVLARSNEHFQSLAPWRKDSDRHTRERAVYLAYETCRITALLARPILPGKMQQMLDILQDATKQEWSDALQLRDSITLSPTDKVEVLFPTAKIKLERGKAKKTKSEIGKNKDASNPRPKDKSVRSMTESQKGRLEEVMA